MRHLVAGCRIQTEWKLDSHSWHCTSDGDTRASYVINETASIFGHFRHIFWNWNNFVSLAALASHDYILKIVPTVYEDLSGKQRFSYQYTVANKVLLLSLFSFPSFPMRSSLCVICCFCTCRGGDTTFPTYGPSMYRRVNLCTHLEVKAHPWWLETLPRCQQTINTLLRTVLTDSLVWSLE